MYTQLSDEEFNNVLQEVLAEKDRRYALSTIPEKVQELAKTFIQGGGDVATLEEAIVPQQ